MELIAKANRHLRKSIGRLSVTDDQPAEPCHKLSYDSEPTVRNKVSLKCPLHNGLLQDPRTLPCGHSYCYSCLEQQYNDKSIITCTVCQKAHSVESVEDLYVDYQLVRALNNVESESDTSCPRDRSADVKQTVLLLRGAEKDCDVALLQIRQMNADVNAMKSSIIAKRKALESKVAIAQTLEDGSDERRMAFECLEYDSDFMQDAICKMNVNVFVPIGETQQSVQKTVPLIKGAGLFQIWLKDEQPMSYKQLKKSTKIISHIWLKQDKFSDCIVSEDADDAARRLRGELAKSLAEAFRAEFGAGEGVWTAVVGARKSLDFFVYSHREFYVCVEMQKTRLLVYRCADDVYEKAVDAGKPALFETFVQQRLDDALKAAKRKDVAFAVRPAQYVSEHLKSGLHGGYWHCIGGPAKTYAIHTTGSRASQTVVHVDGFEYGVWQCDCADKRAQRNRETNLDDSVEYYEPFCDN